LPEVTFTNFVVGGVFFANTNALKNIGLFDENFYDSSIFPPRHMQKPEWTEFLTHIGLKNATEPNDFIELANMIRNKFLDKRLMLGLGAFHLAARRLIDHMTSLKNVNAILKVMKRVRFIPREARPDRINFKIHPVDESDLVCMEDSAFEKNMEICGFLSQYYQAIVKNLKITWRAESS
jgi:hypothetical protein